MTNRIVSAGASRSFPAGADEITAAAGNGLLFVGADAGKSYAAASDLASSEFVAVELGTECLGEHVGLDADAHHAKTVGFARFRLGDAEPTRLVELVKMPWTAPEAVAAARAAFEAGGLVVALCEDFPGRILDRLLRPYFNAVLRRLGYPEGPVALLNRTGLQHHFDVTDALYKALGNTDYAPARRAQIAKARS